MKSAFIFKSYKVDKLIFKMQPLVSLLEFTGAIDPSMWDLKLGIRSPQFVKSSKTYIGGIDAVFAIFPNEAKQDERTSEKALIFLDISIVGLFTASEGRFEPEVEEQLVRNQIPAILFPYLRSAATGLLGSAGFGSGVLPLINMHEVAKQSLGNTPISVTE